MDEVNPDNFKPESQTTVSGADRVKTIGNTIIGVIRTIGSIASIITLIILGIKYMAGSIEEKAKYKESMIPYVIGAALVFGITNVLSLIVDVSELFK